MPGGLISEAKVSGMDAIEKDIKEFASKWIGGYPVLWLVVLIILVVLVIWMYYRSMKGEGFMPTSMMKYMWTSGTLGNEYMAAMPPGKTPVERIAALPPGSVPREHATGAPAVAKSSYYAPGSSADMSANVIPTFVSGGSSDADARVLSDPNLNCAYRFAHPTTTDAWGWMSRQAEGMDTTPRTDYGFSKILAGY